MIKLSWLCCICTHDKLLPKALNGWGIFSLMFRFTYRMKSFYCWYIGCEYIKGSGCSDRKATHCACSYVWYVPLYQTLTLLAAVVLIVFNHELLELAQQLHRLLPDKKQTNTQHQQHRSYLQSQVDDGDSSLHNQWNIISTLLSVLLLIWLLYIFYLQRLTGGCIHDLVGLFLLRFNW